MEGTISLQVIKPKGQLLPPLPELKEIRERRIRLGLSQRELAREIGVSQSSVAKIEAGRISPSYSLVKSIFGYLDSQRLNAFGSVSKVAAFPVVAIQKDDTVLKAVKLFKNNGYKQLPVKDGEIWVGCIYERTISRHIVETNDPKNILKRRVGAIMDEALPTVTENTPIPLVIPLLQQSQAILVTRQGRVTGIVTNNDMLKVVA